MCNQWYFDVTLWWCQCVFLHVIYKHRSIFYSIISDNRTVNSSSSLGLRSLSDRSRVRGKHLLLPAAHEITRPEWRKPAAYQQCVLLDGTDRDTFLHQTSTPLSFQMCPKFPTFQNKTNQRNMFLHLHVPWDWETHFKKQLFSYTRISDYHTVLLYVYWHMQWI